jgi:hypothetical protein
MLFTLMLTTTYFDPYWVINRCISVYLYAEFLFKYGPIFTSYLTIRLCDYCFLIDLWFVYSLALSRIVVKLN